MELENDTPYPAHLFRTSIGGDRFAAAVIVRVTFAVSRDGVCEPASEQVWPVHPGPWESDYGPMEGDDIFVRGGVDLMIFGFARAPGANPVDAMTVRTQLGEFQSDLWVYGDRHWIKEDDRLVPSAPAPFTSMPLDSTRAYGGTCQWDGLDVPFGPNPAGKGFYLDKDMAAVGPLPNLEDPATPVTAWDDMPPPAGVGACPFAHPGRMAHAVFDENGLFQELNPRFYNGAFPSMIADSAHPGALLAVHGVLSDVPFLMRLPQSQLRITLSFGEEVIERELKIDQIGVEPDLGRAFITYRYPFRYVLHPLQTRSCRLAEEVA